MPNLWQKWHGIIQQLKYYCNFDITIAKWYSYGRHIKTFVTIKIILNKVFACQK